MKKPAALVVLCLTFMVVACGKKDDKATASNPVVAQPAPVTPYNPYPYPNPNPNPQDNSLQSWCQAYQGSFNGSRCMITRTYNNNAWFSAQWGDLNTGLPIYPGYRVSVSVSGSPRVLVGPQVIGQGSLSFTANTSGPLMFQKYSFSSYSVQSIQIQACYNAPNQVISCQ